MPVIKQLPEDRTFNHIPVIEDDEESLDPQALAETHDEQED